MKAISVFLVTLILLLLPPMVGALAYLDNDYRAVQDFLQTAIATAVVELSAVGLVLLIIISDS